MAPVRITDVAVAHPPFTLEQAEAAQRIGNATGEDRRVRALARGSQIGRRAVVMPPDEIAVLGSIASRNEIYKQAAPRLALAAACGIDAPVRGEQQVSCLVTSSCTGYMLPHWSVQLSEELGLEQDTMRLPVTEAGCAGGVVALARAADYLRARPGAAGLAVAVELCSLAFHALASPGNLTSALLFGDGAGAARLSTSPEAAGLEIVDSLSLLVPGSRDLLGFDLTDQGFYPQLAAGLADCLVKPTLAGTTALLQRNRLRRDQLSFLLLHPGGPRILDSLADVLEMKRDALRWSWDSLREYGNTSSAAVFDVMRRYLDDEQAPAGWGMVVAFGPGVSIEMLLVRRC